MATLRIFRESDHVEDVPLTEEKITVGRRKPPAPDRIVLDDPTISSNHASLELHGRVYMIQDLNSRNGIMLNGQVIPSERLYPFQVGDRVQICDFILEMSDDAPSPPPKEGFPSAFSGFDLKKIYQPRDVVGGDFFHSHAIDADRLALALGDATGGGRPIGEVTLACTEQVRHLASQNVPPAAAVSRFHQALKGFHSGGHVTVVYGVLDGRDGSFTYVSAGSICPILFSRSKPDHVRKLLTRGDSMVGGQGSVTEASLEVKRVVLNKGDAMVLCTDGVIDASPRGDHNVEMTLKNEVRQAFQDLWGRDLTAFLEGLKAKIDDVDRRAGPFGYQGVARAIAAHGADGVRDLLPAIRAALTQHIGGAEPQDDLTLIGFERTR